MKDRIAEEYKLLELETGIPVDEIPLALTAFDRIFPLQGSWFKEPANDSRRVLMLMPAAMRGIGAFRRHIYTRKELKDLGFKDDTTWRLIYDQNTAARLLDSTDDELIL